MHFKRELFRAFTPPLPKHFSYNICKLPTQTIHHGTGNTVKITIHLLLVWFPIYSIYMVIYGNPYLAYCVLLFPSPIPYRTWRHLRRVEGDLLQGDSFGENQLGCSWWGGSGTSSCCSKFSWTAFEQKPTVTTPFPCLDFINSWRVPPVSFTGEDGKVE